MRLYTILKLKEFGRSFITLFVKREKFSIKGWGRVSDLNLPLHDLCTMKLHAILKD